MKIGLYGGSFNPIHTAHLIIAEWILCELSLDEIHFIPSAQSPLKLEHQALLDIRHRVEMVNLAVAANDKFALNDYESDPGKVHYSAHTVKKIASEMSLKKDDLYFIIGEDNYNIFDKWKQPEVIADLSHIVVAGRNAEDGESFDMNARFPCIRVQTPLIDISSSAIRDRIRTGNSIKYLVPEKVEKYIMENNLYKE